VTGTGAAPGPEADRDLVKAEVVLRWRGEAIKLLAPRSVFASSAVDRGTHLLLEHLPPGEPRRFLDLGCGYGALGLAVARRFPSARGLLVDRDLLAVEFARRNADRLGVTSVDVAGSLGYRDVPASWLPFDWILLNAPARAGERALEALIERGRRRLARGGEMRVVVIRPLAPAIAGIAGRAGVVPDAVAERDNHAVFAFPAPPPGAETAGAVEGDEVYERDVIELHLPEPLRLARPTDLADEPHRLPAAIPLLAASLPVAAPGRALAFRCGYGLIPALLLARYPRARVTAADRDLLALAFTPRNCAPWGDRLETVASVSPAAGAPRGAFDLVAGELLPSLGPRATVAELAAVRGALAPGGLALVLGLHKEWRESLRDGAAHLGLRIEARRGAAALYGMRGG
jgi:16S rRNA G1207 methylase RsmC